MQPYYRLVESRAAEAEVIRREGKPGAIITTNAQLRRWYKDFEPYSRAPQRVHNKVLVYWADPWNDGDGYLVYVFIGSDGRAYAAAFGG